MIIITGQDDEQLSMKEGAKFDNDLSLDNLPQFL